MSTDVHDPLEVTVPASLREQPYRAIFNLTSDAVFIFDDHGRIVEVNPSACTMHGYTREEFIGMRGTQFIHPDDHHKFAEFVRHVKAGKRYHVEGTHMRKDGGAIPVKVTGTAFVFADRPALLAVVQDMTEERRALDALRAREQHLNAVVQNTPECVKIVAADGTLLQMNPAGLAMVEADSAGTVTGKPVETLIAPEHRDAFRSFNAKICRGESGVLQFDIIGLRGTRRQMETHAVPLRNPDGTVAQLALTHDITARKRTEQTLRESEARFRATFRQAAVGMAQTDLNGRHVLVNDRYCEITGYGRDELLARTFLDITHPDDLEMNRQRFHRLLSEVSSAYNIEKRYIRKDGGVVWAHVTVSFVLDDEGIPQYVIGAIQDISAQKRKEQALQFLVDLNAVTQPLTEPEEIMMVTARMLGEYLGVDRCAYAEVEPDGDHFTVAGGYTRGEQVNFGRLSISSFGAEAYRLAQANRSYVVNDVDTDSRVGAAELQVYRYTHIQALICVPLHKAGHIVAGMVVHQRTPRVWLPDEIELVELVVGRCWESIERARTLRILRENEQRQRFIMDSMPQKIFTARPNGEVDYFNRRWIEFCGLPFEQIRDWGWTQFVHPDDVEENLDLWRHAVATGELFQAEHRFRRADGEYRWHMSRALPMRDDEGRIIMWIGSNTDVHDLKEAEAELVRLTAESERQRRLYETILASTPDLVYVFDLDHRFSYANRALLEMWGRTKDDALGKNCLELGYPDWHAAMHDRELERVKATRQPIRGEVPFTGTHGRRIYDYIFVPVLGADGEVEAIAGTTRDVTERRQAEEATSRRSEQVRRLAEVATRINAAHDVTSVIRMVTEEARNLIGSHQSITTVSTDENWANAINVVSLSDKYGHWRNYDARPEGAGIYRLVRNTNKPMRMTQTELEAHPAWKGFGAEAGKHPPLRGWLAAPLVGRDGRNIGLIQLSDKYEHEFTEDDEAVLVQLAQMASVAIENARLVEDLRDASRRKDEFLATLAHELRNPLAPLRNMLEVIKRTDGTAEQLQQAHAMMDRQLVHMVRLIDDLLDVSRVSRGKLELRRERVELATVVSQAVEACKGLIKCADHALDIALPPEPVWLYADPVRLTQIFDNLINNACKYSEAGGRIELNAECRNDEVTVRIKDTGIGIPPDKLGSIFEMFTQVDHSLERMQGGLGIGLTLVKQLVEMHDGSVAAHSDGPGRGSEFVVRLPLLSAPQTGESPQDERTEQSGPRRILVVDDNWDSAESLAMLLGLSGNETRVAHDGQEAIEAAERFRPDLVLLDIGLPQLNGYEVCRRIRRQPWGKDMMIVAVSGWGQEQDRLRSQEAGFDHHVVKPVDFAALTGLLG